MYECGGVCPWLQGHAHTHITQLGVCICSSCFSCNIVILGIYFEAIPLGGAQWCRKRNSLLPHASGRVSAPTAYPFFCERLGARWGPASVEAGTRALSLLLATRCAEALTQMPPVGNTQGIQGRCPSLRSGVKAAGSRALDLGSTASKRSPKSREENA